MDDVSSEIQAVFNAAVEGQALRTLQKPNIALDLHKAAIENLLHLLIVVLLSVHRFTGLVRISGRLFNTEHVHIFPPKSKTDQ